MYKYFRQGQSLPMVALMLAVMLTLLGLVIDTARFVITQQHTQWIADSAALAAATQAATMSTSNILDDTICYATLSAAATDYTQYNNLQKTSINTKIYVTVTNSIDESITTTPAVIVVAVITVPYKYLFGQLINKEGLTITTSATAGYDPGKSPVIALSN